MNSEINVKKQNLPFYSEGEEIINVVSHALGVVLGIAMIIIVSLYHQNTTQLVSGILFGLSLVVLYSMSCVYHGLSSKGSESEDKKKFRVFDHCSIPILIAGSYVPFALCILEPARSGLGLKLLGFVSFIGFVIIAMNIIDLDRFKVITMIGYFLMGGSSLIVSDILMKGLSSDGFALFAAGGLAYSIGAIFYGLGGKSKIIGESKKWMHSIFHMFCILGSILHCVCIYSYVFWY